MYGTVTDGRDWQKRMEHIQQNLRAKREGRPQTDYETGAAIPEADEHAHEGGETAR